MKKFIVILIIFVAIAVGVFVVRLYRHDMKSLTEFAAAYERFDRERTAGALSEFKAKSDFRLSSLIKNEQKTMSLAREIANIAEKEFDSLVAGFAKDAAALAAQRKSAYARFQELGGSEKLPLAETSQSSIIEGPVVLDYPQKNSIVTSPLTVTGKAKGQWFFEASFPIVLVDENKKVIAEGHVSAEGDWMTTDYVRFSGTLEFKKPAGVAKGFLILKKDNPSGLPDKDDSREIPIVF